MLGDKEVRWCRDYKEAIDIAKELGRNKSSVSRALAEKARIGRGRYNADIAHKKSASPHQQPWCCPEDTKVYTTQNIY